MNIYEQEWLLTEQDRKVRELAEQYHRDTEGYDRAVCTGPIKEGVIWPATIEQMRLINRNALQRWKEVMKLAEQHGISRRIMQRAISRFKGPI